MHTKKRFSKLGLIRPNKPDSKHCHQQSFLLHQILANWCKTFIKRRSISKQGFHTLVIQVLFNTLYLHTYTIHIKLYTLYIDQSYFFNYERSVISNYIFLQQSTTEIQFHEGLSLFIQFCKQTTYINLHVTIPDPSYVLLCIKNTNPEHALQDTLR